MSIQFHVPYPSAWKCGKDRNVLWGVTGCEDTKQHLPAIPRTLIYPAGLFILLSWLSILMLRQLQDPNKDFQEPFVPVVSAVEAGGTLRRHTQARAQWWHCWPDIEGLKKWEKALESNQLPTCRVADGQGENTTTSPSETAAGKSLCREKHEEQLLRHQDVNRIWEYLCLSGDCTSKREGKQQLWCPKGMIPYYLLFYSLEKCGERRGRKIPSSPPSGCSLTWQAATQAHRLWVCNLASPEKEKIAMLPSCFSSNKQRSGLNAALGLLSFIQQGQVTPEAGPGCCPGPAGMGKKKELVLICALIPHD